MTTVTAEQLAAARGRVLGLMPGDAVGATGGKVPADQAVTEQRVSDPPLTFRTNGNLAGQACADVSGVRRGAPLARISSSLASSTVAWATEPPRTPRPPRAAR